MLHRRWPRLRNLAVPLLFAYVTLVLAAGQAHAEDIRPVGVGDLMPSPDLKVPDGQGTLYETYGDEGLWILDEQFGVGDAFEASFHMIADIFMALTAAITKGCIVIVQWIFQLTSIPALENAVTKSIGGAAQGLTATLLPAALAVGGIVAFAQHKKGGGGLSQIAWVLISGVFSISLLTSPQTWVDGVDSARQVGASVTMQATSAGLGDGEATFPFETKHEPRFTGNGRDDMLRKSADSVWRSYTATPWCVAEFGSLEVCEKYGADLLEQGTDRDAREEWLKSHVSDATVGEESVSFRQGHEPGTRVVITILAFINVVLFAILIITLAFTSLASLLGALMLLLTGVIFACLWVIPGRPRQWGLAWFDQILARTLESLIATMVLGAVLSIQAATSQIFAEYGWLPTSGLSIAAATVGLKFRDVLAQIFGVRGASSGGMMAGVLVSRMLNRNSGGGNGGARKIPPHNRFRNLPPLPRPTPGAGGGGGGTRPWDPDIIPALPLGTGAGSSASPAVTLTRVRPRPPAPRPIPAPAGAAAGAAGGNGALPAGTPAAKPAATAIPTAAPRPAAIPAQAAAALPAGTPPPAPVQPPRPALSPAGGGNGAAAGTNTPGTATGTPPQTPASPVMRPEAGGTPTYAFRQAPPPTAAAASDSRIIQGTVIRRVDTPVGPNSGGRPSQRTPQPPPRAAAPPDRRPTAPSTRSTDEG
ncbi:hypothetical protein [Streptomyces sp. NPDC053541]|uniref:hypothetical protein n=1 Tax=Streptomyces sp. NPDC053541 TaxID=3365709 RepID=UPI0037CFE8AE